MPQRSTTRKAKTHAVTARARKPKHFLSDKVSHFTESVIREMTRQAMLYGAVNLAQGFPDFSGPAGNQAEPRSRLSPPT